MIHNKHNKQQTLIDEKHQIDQKIAPIKIFLFEKFTLFIPL